jgi:DNA-binding transcriptional ArsR family regulator
MKPDLTYAELSETKKEILRELVEFEADVNWEHETREKTVGELTEHIDKSRTHISTQVNEMLEDGILRKRKDGRKIYYTISERFYDITQFLTVQDKFISLIKDSPYNKSYLTVNQEPTRFITGHTALITGLPSNDKEYLKEEIEIDDDSYKLEKVLKNLISEVNRIRHAHIEESLREYYEDKLTEVENKELREILENYEDEILRYFRLRHQHKGSGQMYRYKTDETRRINKKGDFIVQHSLFKSMELVDEEMYEKLMDFEEEVNSWMGDILNKNAELGEDFLTLNILEGRQPPRE